MFCFISLIHFSFAKLFLLFALVEMVHDLGEKIVDFIQEWIVSSSLLATLKQLTHFIHSIELKCWGVEPQHPQMDFVNF